MSRKWKKRKNSNKAHGFAETLAHLMNLKEDSEFHYGNFRKSIDAALTLNNPIEKRRHIAHVRLTLIGFIIDVIHTAKIAKKHFPDRLIFEKIAYKKRIEELEHIRDKAAHPPYEYSGWEILERRKEIDQYIVQLVDQLTSILEDGYRLKESNIDELVRFKRKKALDADLEVTRQAQSRKLEDSFKRSQLSWQNSNIKV